MAAIWNLLVGISGILEQHIAAITAVIAVAAICQWRETRKGSERQLRAYISVSIGRPGHVQDRANNLRFEGKPTLKNSGQTPAYKVRVWHRAEILAANVIPNFNFDLPTPEEGISEDTIGPGEIRHMRCIVPDFINDADVPAVTSGLGACLWVWGILKYEDAFKNSRHTKFCQRLYWLPDGTTEGEYSRRFSDST